MLLSEEPSPDSGRQPLFGIGITVDGLSESPAVTLGHHQHHGNVRRKFVEPLGQLAHADLCLVPAGNGGVVGVRVVSFVSVSGDIDDEAVPFPGSRSDAIERLLDQFRIIGTGYIGNLVIPVSEPADGALWRATSMERCQKLCQWFVGPLLRRGLDLQVFAGIIAIGKEQIVNPGTGMLLFQDSLVEQHIGFQ